MKENKRYGKLITLKKVSKRTKNPRKDARWLCKCDCGNEKIINESSLQGGSTKSCGCLVGINAKDYPERIRNKIKDNIQIDQNDCWIWQKKFHKQGYGIISYKQRGHLTHRISWIVFNGEIPKGIKVCHHCDIPSCCNPKHLFLGTQKDNVNDGIEKGRYENRDISKNRRNKLNFEQVQEIKILHKNGMTRKELREKYYVGQTCIAKILNGISWKTNWTQEL